jgi:hypothetical protein
MRQVIVLICALLICGPGCSLDPARPGAELVMLRMNQAKWKTSGFQSYVYEFRRGCFCAPQIVTARVRITVENQQVVDVVIADSGEPVPKQDADLYFNRTIEDLFSVVEEAILKPAASLTVEYDAVAGYPRLVRVDWIKGIADDENTYEAVIVDL